VTVLDPMCGRGTTLTTAWLLGHDAAGVEVDLKAVTAMEAFLKTYLRRKRIKHQAELNPVRRQGKVLGKRLDITADLPGGTRQLTVFSGDTRQAAALFGKKRFAAIVVDAPYGVVHGAHNDVHDPGRRDRSAASLLRQAIPVWASQLSTGGALGLSWNSLTWPRAELWECLAAAGLEPCQGGPWDQLAHRVDSSIQRDVVVARRP
jgi:tRNA G10  N-methylase Trm11